MEQVTNTKNMPHPRIALHAPDNKSGATPRHSLNLFALFR